MTAIVCYRNRNGVFPSNLAGLDRDGARRLVARAGWPHRARVGVRRRLARRRQQPLVCHAPAVAARLGLDDLPARDLLELYAFVRPATFCLPTPRGLCEALDLPVPATPEEEVASLPEVARALLDELDDMAALASPDLKDTALAMARGQWPWGDAVLAALGIEQAAKKPRPGAGLDVWRTLPQWEEPPPAPPPGSAPVESREARLRLAQMISAGPNMAEARPTQSDYASAASPGLRAARGGGQAQRRAGRGRHRRRQDAGLRRAGVACGPRRTARRCGSPPTPATCSARSTTNSTGCIRDSAREAPPRGDPQGPRELSLPAELPGGGAAQRPAAGERRRPRPAGALGAGQPRRRHDRRRSARPGCSTWSAAAASRRLADRRGECIYSACEHYRKCFVERTIRRARQADIVIANHALVMIQAAMGGLDDATRPLRYVFDEGHHLFDAADGAFGAHLSGVEASDLRRWLLGAEGRRGSRARGLERRVSDLLGEDAEALNALQRLLDLAQRLPGTNWQTRLADGTVLGPAEEFLALVRQQVRARVGRRRPGLWPGMRRAAAQSRPDRSRRPARPVAGADAGAGAPPAPGACAPSSRPRPTTLDSGQRGRIEGVARSLTNRCEMHARSLARHAARPAQRSRPRLRRLVRRRAQPAARDRCRHVPPLSRSHRAVRELGDPAVARRGHHLGHLARFAGRAGRRQRRGARHERRLGGGRGAHRREASAAPAMRARWPRRSTMPTPPRC